MSVHMLRLIESREHTLELDLQAAVSCTTRMLGLHLGPLKEQCMAPNH